MATTKKFILKRDLQVCLLTIFFITGCNGNKQDGEKQETTSKTNVDPLPSWNGGELKHAIITYVKNVTDSTSKDFVSVGDRIATFDNDGTLWSEHPYVQELFVFLW